MAPRSFFSATQEMSISQSSRSGAMAQPLEATEFEEEQTYGSSSESGSDSESIGENSIPEGMDVDALHQAEVREKNLLVLARNAQSMGEDLEHELKLQSTSILSNDNQNSMAHPAEVNMEKALGISTRLSACTKVMEKRIKETQHQNETYLHSSTMAQKEAERAEKETLAQIEQLRSEHGQTLLSIQSQYNDRPEALEAEMAVEKIKSAAIEQRLKEVECLLLAKSDVTTELEAKLQYMDSRRKDLEIMKSIVERRLLGEPKRRKMAVKAALDSAEAEMSRKADSFGKTYLKSALDILKRQYPNIDFSMIENGDLLGTDDPQTSTVPPSNTQKTDSKSESES